MKANVILALSVLVALARQASAYPPGVGILGKAKDCLVCHVSNGPWGDDTKLIIDILDPGTKGSLRQPDGSFSIVSKRGEARTVLTVIGRTKEDQSETPYRNAWLYIDQTTIERASLSKFAPGWDVNLPMACRLVGDKLEGLEGANITVLPMTIMPTAVAEDAEIILQVMMTKGAASKGKPKEGMLSNYFERKVRLKVTE